MHQLARLHPQRQLWLASLTVSSLGCRTLLSLWHIRLLNWLVCYFLCWMSNHVPHPYDLFSIWVAGRAVGTSGKHQMPKHGDPTQYTNWEQLDRTPVSLLKSRLESALPSLGLRETEQIHFTEQISIQQQKKKAVAEELKFNQYHLGWILK